jgi:hypothetical protein
MENDIREKMNPWWRSLDKKLLRLFDTTDMFFSNDRNFQQVSPIFHKIGEFLKNQC